MAPGGSPEHQELARHPIVAEAREQGEDIFTAWRLAYQLPPNDPRFLDITEDEIVTDLLVRRHHFDTLHRIHNPREADMEEARNNPAALEMLRKLTAAVASDPGLVRAWRATGVLPPEAPARRPVTVNATAKPRKKTAP